MANILDYLDWRGDIPFSEDPFNEVDGLILSEFSYLPLEGIVPKDFTVRMLLRNVYQRFVQRVKDDADLYTYPQDKELFQKLAESRRYQFTQLTGHQSFLDAETELQFSAMTCILEDGTAFVVYRGTDNTIIGWKEDFNLSYVQQTGAQMYALDYLNDNFTRFPRQLRVGGHSKGGNLAVYASAFCKPEIRSQIQQVLTYDGPGFREEIVNTDAYRSMLPRVSSYIPESSVIGLLLSNDMQHIFVKCSVSGIMQHLAYNWDVMRNRFVQAEELSKSGSLVNKTISGFLSDMNDEDRKTLVGAVFDVIGAPEKDTFREINQDKKSSYSAMLKAVKNLSFDQQKTVLESIVKIAKNSKDALESEENDKKHHNDSPF